MCWSDGRQEGFRDYLIEAGFEENIHIYDQQRVSNLWYYKQSLVHDWLLSLPKPVGIFACDDNQASILVEACDVLGIRIPYDAAIIGVDNDEIICGMSNPPISSIDVDIERGGYEAAAMAVQMMKDPSYTGEDIVLQPLYIVTRESSNLITTRDVQVHSALTFIHSNVEHKILVPDVLAHVAMSRRLLEQRFLRATGKTIYQYISEQRVDHFAALLLDTKDSIANLAARMDEPDPKSLSRRFKEIKGCTPSEYRKKNLRKMRE
jgi:LacI family transcriptional regulator